MARKNTSPSSNGALLFAPYRFTDPILINQLATAARSAGEATRNAYGWMARPDISQTIDPRRDVEEACGIPKITDNVDAEFYQRLYDRDAVAARVVELYPKESWQTTPEVFESEDPDEVTEFEEAFDQMQKDLRSSNGLPSFYQDNEGSPFWEELLNADILAGIGSHGVLLLGIDDGKDLREPAAGIEETNSFGAKKAKKGEDAELVENKQYRTIHDRYQLTVNKSEKRVKLLYMRSFSEAHARVVRWENNRSSPRFGMPTAYLIDFTEGEAGGIGAPIGTQEVHWSRVIHICDRHEQASSSDLSAPPRMRAVLGNVLSLHKLYLADAEGYWGGAFPGHSFETHPALGGDVDVDMDLIKDEYEQWFNSLQRLFVSTGGTLKDHSPQVSDPTPHIKVQIEAICIKKGCPVRIFVGSERGELASSNDDGAWNDRLRLRQNRHNTPKLALPTIDRLIAFNVLPEPKVGNKKKEPKDAGEKPESNRVVNKFGRRLIVNAAGKVIGEASRAGYSVKWPDLESQTAAEKANVLNLRTTALATYSGGDPGAVIPEREWLTREWGMTDEEADAVLEAAMAKAEEEMEEQALAAEESQTLADEHGFEPTPPEGFAKPEPKEPQPPIKVRPGEKLVKPEDA